MSRLLREAWSLMLGACSLALQEGLVLLSEPGHLFPVFGAVVCHAASGSRSKNFLSAVITALRTVVPSRFNWKVLLPASSSCMSIRTPARRWLLVFELPTQISRSTKRGPGPTDTETSNKHQAPSSESHKQQASSVKHKGSSAKPQASSSLIIDPGKSFTDL